ncbi:MAG: PD-(D/E)XK nuclease family protein [Solirubrobacterales bacterium]
MPLKLIQGPPNSGKRELVRARLAAQLASEPVLVVPTLDAVFSFERELCAGGAALGAQAMTFGALFGAIATAAGSPPSAMLSAAQRSRLVAAVAAGARGLGPLRRSARRPGFAPALARLLDELQGAAVEPEEVEASAATLEGSAYLADIASLFAAYAAARDRLGRLDSHGVARRAIAALAADEALWRGRPVFLYGFDDLTPNQFELLAALAGRAEVTVALTYAPGNAALAARAGLLEALGERIGIAATETAAADPASTESAALFALAARFGEPAAAPLAAAEGLTLLRSAGARGEAEAIAAEVSRLVHDGAEPAAIAIALRDPGRRGPEIAAALERNEIATALEAELPVAATAVGGALLALLEAEFGRRRAADLLRYMRGPSGLRPGGVDWFERRLRQGRVEDAATALARWQGEEGEPPHDLLRLREAAALSPAALCAEVGSLAATMASRPLRGEGDGPPLGPGDGLELRAAGAIAAALSELAELGELCPAAEELAGTLQTLSFRVWSGPVEGRVRIARPQQLRAGRFDHVFVASLQDGEFPRRDRGSDPFLSEAQRLRLGLDPRRDTEAEERYLFGACLALPRRGLHLSWRDSDENGGAEARSPLLDEVERLLDPAAAVTTRVRDLARVVEPLAEAPSEDELARALAAHGPAADGEALIGAAGVEGPLAERLRGRLAAARRADAASRAPGPLTNPAVIEALANVAAYGGTTLELFDVCSYRWFADHELAPQPLEPAPDPLVQGGLMHGVLERLYAERPGGDPLPRPGSLPAWSGRGRELLADLVGEREIGEHPAERAMVRRVARLLDRFLAEEAARETGGFVPWLLEASFGAEPDSERPTLDLGGWGLHGAIDRVDRAADGRAVVLDYKLSSAVTARQKFEEEAKLQLPLYLLAVAEHWGAAPVGGLYHPLRGTSSRRPRGVIAAGAAGALAGYRLYDRDVVEEEEFAELLEDSRRRAGEIVARMRAGEIRRDPGPRPGLRGHDVCPQFCTYAPICRRDRAPRYVEVEEDAER